ncbi:MULTISPECIES: TetR/AcrR family transcriptional regulator [unclassified Gordonia (in: high G+C Gram-positive bacteria)]
MPAPELDTILTAALESFSEHGYHGTSVRDIARLAGLSVPSLYYRYDSKEGVLYALLTYGLGRVIERVEAAAASSDDPTEQLAHVVEAIVLTMTRNAAVSSLDVSEARYLGPQRHQEYAVMRADVEHTVTAILKAGIESAGFRIDDVPETMRAILGMTQAIPRWYQSDGSDRPEEIAARYAQLALRMVGSPAAG